MTISAVRPAGWLRILTWSVRCRMTAFCRTAARSSRFSPRVSGRRPERVIGKPDTAMIDMILLTAAWTEMWLPWSETVSTQIWRSRSAQALQALLSFPANLTGQISKTVVLSPNMSFHRSGNWRIAPAGD